MRQLRAYCVRLGELFYRKRRDQELAEELESHVQLHIDDNLRAGMDPVEARRQALIKFGGMESAAEAYRERRGFSFGLTVWQDLRYAVRMLRKSPGFTAAVVLSLALGIGANTAIFSLIDAVMLQFLAVRNPEQLVLLKWNWQGPGQLPPAVHSYSGSGEGSSFSYSTFKDVRANRDIFSSTLALSPLYDSKLNLSVDGQAGLADGEMVSGEYFSELGIRPAIGRLFTDLDDRPGSPPTAVISDQFWRRRFGQTSSIVGKVITINAIPSTIIGVAQPEFFGVRPGTAVEVWIPLTTQPQVEPLWTENGQSKFLRRDDWWLTIMGRLQPGVSRQAALAQLDVAFKRSLPDPDPKTQVGPKPARLPNLDFTEGGKGLKDLHDQFSQPLFILMAVVALVLLIACANVANLLLARATSRHREIAVRLAVGAARRRVVRQLLTESILLSATGGAVGLGLAYWATHLLVTLMASGREPISLTVRPNLHVLVFTTAVILITGILFGLVPALQTTRLDLSRVLKEKSQSAGVGSAGMRFGLGKVLVISQVAISLLLVLGAGLFVRTLGNLESINTGFDRKNILLFTIDPTQNGYEGERLAQLYEELLRNIEIVPGVRASSFSRHSLVGGGGSTSGFSIQGYTPNPGESHDGALGIDDNLVGPGFFETMGIPLMLGRTINSGDTNSSSKVAVVNESFVRKYLESSNPIGRRFGHDPKSSGQIEIVGVVGDAKYHGLRDKVPATIYLPRLQIVDSKDYGGITFEVRTVGDPHDLIPAIRHAVQSLDPNLPLSNVRTQVEQIDQTLLQERLFAKLSSFFGLLALVLACIGLYGIMSYAVARRTNEIGIRMALGARQEDILRKVLRETLVLVLVGVAIGIPIALGALRLISTMLFGLKPTDPLTLAGAIAFMLAVAAFAGYLPARRASRVDPMVALRYE